MSSSGIVTIGRPILLALVLVVMNVAGCTKAISLSSSPIDGKKNETNRRLFAEINYGPPISFIEGKGYTCAKLGTGFRCWGQVPKYATQLQDFIQEPIDSMAIDDNEICILTRTNRLVCRSRYDDGTYSYDSVLDSNHLQVDHVYNSKYGICVSWENLASCYEGPFISVIKYSKQTDWIRFPFIPIQISPVYFNSHNGACAIGQNPGEVACIAESNFGDKSAPNINPDQKRFDDLTPTSLAVSKGRGPFQICVLGTNTTTRTTRIECWADQNSKENHRALTIELPFNAHAFQIGANQGYNNDWDGSGDSLLVSSGRQHQFLEIRYQENTYKPNLIWHETLERPDYLNPNPLLFGCYPRKDFPDLIDCLERSSVTDRWQLQYLERVTPWSFKGIKQLQYGYTPSALTTRGLLEFSYPTKNGSRTPAEKVLNIKSENRVLCQEETDRWKCHGWMNPNNDYGYPEIKLEISKATYDKPVMAYDQICARKQDGLVDCWSEKGIIQSTNTFGTDPVQEIVAGSFFVCGKKHAGWKCIVRGAETDKTMEDWVPPQEMNIATNVNAGFGYLCGLVGSGRNLKCWSPYPGVVERMHLTTETGIDQLAVGSAFVCAVKSGLANCYGNIPEDFFPIVPTEWGKVLNIVVNRGFERLKIVQGCVQTEKGIGCFGPSEGGLAEDPSPATSWFPFQ